MRIRNLPNLIKFLGFNLNRNIHKTIKISVNSKPSNFSMNEIILFRLKY